MPSNDSVDDERNPVPATVIVCGAAPAETEAGEMDVIAGTGFCVAGGVVV
ncbi:hypothetical protein GRAN_1249 [Granulicella sibirica]|uniref:Uncharacterized protein n=1 Tax=Granulicella sibirica TaxID=2479048 RepID=A0A4Q0T7D9_9BACT|nr:hypothetical protein GRAN_1249 [Granulicella sibirica]